MGRHDLTAQQACEAVDYDPIAGLFRYLNPHSRSFKGWHNGAKGPTGYRVLKIGEYNHLAHRIALLMLNGHWPDHCDHINGIRIDNRACNLRDVSALENAQNRRRGHGVSGFLGVKPDKGKWNASIFSEGKKTNLGNYDTPELAHAVYLEAKRKLHIGCTI